MVPHRLLLLTTTLLTCCCSSPALSLSSFLKIPSRRTSFKEFVSPSAKIGLFRELVCTGVEKRETISSQGLFLTSAAASGLGASQMQGDDIDKNQNNLQTHLQLEDTTDFHLLTYAAIQTLIYSDLDGEELDHSYGSASQGLWMHAPSAKKMQQLLNRVTLKLPTNKIDSTSAIQQEACEQWLNWMKASPSPLFLDLTSFIHDLATLNPHWVSQEHLNDTTLAQFISRLACHIIFLPSGSETSSFALVESTGAHIYGKLLYGGVSRYRLLKSGTTVRRVGERREVESSGNQKQSKLLGGHPSWVQLGGLERKYEAIDMGPAAIFELTFLPKLWKELPTIFEKGVLMGGARDDMTITHSACGWDSSMLRFLPEGENMDEDCISEDPSHEHAFESLEGVQQNDAIRAHFQCSVGGLQPQIDAIVRRVLDGRSVVTIFKHVSDESVLNRSRLEAEELSLLGLQPVRGVLLYGQPGVGKTLIAREIANLISRTPPKIVGASELLDRWVGGSERLVRELFHDAEEELKRCQMAVPVGEEDMAYLNSALHVIVVDEIDAVFRKRTDSNDIGSNSRDSVVNQLLAKLDGVNALPNILLIGMTNRRELLDPALLRPGRLEVQIEIPLPQHSQRREILQLHFGALRERSRLSYPLRCAIDGVSPKIDDDEPKYNAFRTIAKRFLGSLPSLRSSIADDLAAETEGFSGADIAGLVRCAGSRALARVRKEGTGVDCIVITLDDVKQAIDEVIGGVAR